MPLVIAWALCILFPCSQVETETAAIVQAEAEETLFGCILHEMAGSCLIVSANIEGGLNGFANNYFVSHVY